MKRTYLDYIQYIREECQNILSFVEGIGKEKFINDKMINHAVVRSFEIIGEAIKNIPLELRMKYDESFEWKRAAGLKYLLIHEYFGVDLEILWKLITDGEVA